MAEEQLKCTLLEFTVPEDCAGTRLDRCLSRLINGSSRSFLQKLIRNGSVRDGNGLVLTVPRFPVSGGMKIAVEVPEQTDETLAPAASDFDFSILYEDDHMLVIDKPAMVVVHPAVGNAEGTVVNALYGRYPGLLERFGNVSLRPGIVHRLDKETSGCLAIAKTPDAQFQLGTAFAERRTGKCYLAVVRGIPQRSSGEIKNLIGRHPVNRQKMAVVERNGKLAHSVYTVLASGEVEGVKISLVKVRIFTGRTHQIRVHMASIGHPVLGDSVYGGSRTGISGAERQLLHAWKLELPHPASGEMMKFTAPVPEDFKKFVNFLQYRLE